MPTSVEREKKQLWIEQVIAAINPSGFEIYSLRNVNQPINGVLNIYIEGDGHIWDRGLPSDNPTPIKALALEMALEQPNGAVAYLARPCQFIGVGKNPDCVPLAWTDQRFSPDVVRDLNHAVEVLKRQTGARKIRLVGYSGGGALALLIAISRPDIVGVVTVSGNIDIDAWTSYHQLNPLKGSLNPALYLTQIQQVPQIHFVGSRDEVVPQSLTQDLIKRYASNMPSQIIVMPNHNHSCCWVEQWPKLWNQTIKE